jgi:hypothetical protein
MVLRQSILNNFLCNLHIPMYSIHIIAGFKYLEFVNKKILQFAKYLRVLHINIVSQKIKPSLFGIITMHQDTSIISVISELRPCVNRSSGA